MSARVTTWLALLVLLAASWFWADGGWAPLLGGREPPPASGPRLLAIDPATVREIRVSAESSTTRFRRIAGGWAGTERPDLVEDFLDNLGVLGVIFSEPAVGEQLRDYGLAPPRYRVELQTPEGPVLLLVGDRNPSGTGVYVQIGSERAPVILTGSLLLWEIEKLLRNAVPAPPGS